MSLFKKQIKIFNAASCILVAMLFWTAGCSSPGRNPKADAHDPASVWNDMKARLTAGDIQGAISCFSIASQDKYRQAFSSLSKTEMNSFVKGLGSIKQSSIETDKAEYYFENMVDGQKITFPIEFDKENGEWKIMEF